MTEKDDDALELYVGENDPRVPYLGLQVISTPNGEVLASQVNGMTIDVYEIEGVQVGGVCLYDPNSRNGIIVPVHADGLRVLAQAMLNAAQHVENHALNALATKQ